MLIHLDKMLIHLDKMLIHLAMLLIHLDTLIHLEMLIPMDRVSIHMEMSVVHLGTMLIHREMVVIHLAKLLIHLVTLPLKVDPMQLLSNNNLVSNNIILGFPIQLHTQVKVIQCLLDKVNFPQGQIKGITLTQGPILIPTLVLNRVQRTSLLELGQCKVNFLDIQGQ